MAKNFILWKAVDKNSLHILQQIVPTEKYIIMDPHFAKRLHVSFSQKILLMLKCIRHVPCLTQLLISIAGSCTAGCSGSQLCIESQLCNQCSDDRTRSLLLILQFATRCAASPTTPRSPSNLKMLGLYPPSAFDAYKKEKTRFSASIDAVVEQIHAACDGVGTDDKALVKLLGPLTPNDRGLISLRYKELHGQSLREQVKSETSGPFGYLLQLICFSLPQAEAYILFHAMKGAGTSDHLLYSVLMGRTNEEIGLLKKAFFEMYDTDLSVAISDEISGDFLAVIMKALQVNIQ